MGHTYTKSLFHCVFSTRDREPVLKPDIRARLWPFIGGIARENGMHALSVGGYFDHVHMLLSLKPTHSVSKAMQEIKAGSSKFLHDEFPTLRNMHWQEGYGAFSISISGVEETKQYIEQQEEHHKAKTFKEEFIAFLVKNGIEYDEKYVWG